jgi:addiction module HigA family antidote
MRKVPYPHPGEILLEEFLKPMEITQYRLAKEIGVPQRRIGEIVAGARAVTADTGLRLSRFFGMSEGFWIGLQMDYDAARVKDILGKSLAKIKPWNRGEVHPDATARPRHAAASKRGRKASISEILSG